MTWQIVSVNSYQPASLEAGWSEFTLSAKYAGLIKPQRYKIFFILNSTEHDISAAHKN